MLRKTTVCLLIAAALVAVPAVPASAADWYVAQLLGSDLNDGTTPVTAFRSITRGMQAAGAGDTVNVLAGVSGVYSETVTGEGFPIVMKSGVVLQGAGAGQVTIRGNGASAAISGVSIDEAARIDGFTITGGRPGLDFAASRLTVSGNRITGNTGPGYKGAGIHSNAGSLRILGNVIEENSADAYGGGINLEVSDTSYVAGNTIQHNSASGGGGIECYYRCSPTIIGNVISHNVAASGGGILIESGGGYLPYVAETVIDGNTVTGTGGGIYLYSASATLVNCRLAGNSASSASAISGMNSGSSDVVNCTIADNTGSVYAVGRASTSWPFSLTVRNSIVRGSVDPGVAAAVTYSDVEGGYAGTGNIDADPLFVDATAGDYHLGPGSPCIDAGTEEPLSPVDLDGSSRPYGTAWDMGAYEWSTSAPVADAGGPYEGIEGRAIELDAGASSGDGILSWDWDLDADGQFDDASGERVSYAYGDDYHGEIHLRVTDAAGLSDVGSAWMDVSNQQPVLGDLAVPEDAVAVPGPVEVSADLADGGTADTHTVTIDWGDGEVTGGTIVESGGSGTASGSHTYASAGVFAVAVTVTDDDAATSAPAGGVVVVYDALAGSAAGHGRIDSPPGAYAADPSLSGQAAFDFVSRYKKDATAPEGQVRFEFEAGGLEFASTAQQWLVVEGPEGRAQMRCAGTVGGVLAPGGVPFDCMVWAGDGDGPAGEDTFRIRIWYEGAGGTESVVYDNGARQPIRLGQVVVNSGTLPRGSGRGMPPRR